VQERKCVGASVVSERCEGCERRCHHNTIYRVFGNSAYFGLGSSALSCKDNKTSQRTKSKHIHSYSSRLVTMISSVRSFGLVKQVNAIHRGLHFRPQYGAFINGKEQINDQGVRYKLHSPASGEYLCDVVNTTEAQTNEAIEIAQRTFESGVWSKADVRERAKVLNNIAHIMRAEVPRLLELEVAQTGRAIKEMKAQLGRLPEWFEYFSALIRTHEGTVPPFSGAYVNYVKRVPLGVCGLLTPWYVFGTLFRYQQPV
jgi:hypothetical protein